MRNILVCDLCMKGVGHVFFNSAFIKILLNIYKDDIVYYAESEHLKYVYNSIDSSRLSTYSISILCPTGWRVVLADIWNLLLFLFVLFKNINKFENLYILNRLPITMFVANFLNLFLRKRVFNVIHGEVEYLVNPNTTGYSKKYSKIFKLAYKLSTKKSVYIILGESIFDSLKKAGISFGNGNYIIIDHPYDYNFKFDRFDIFSKDFYNIGCIGSATKRKNTQYLFKLRDCISSNKIKLSIIGELSSDLSLKYNLNGIDYFKNKISGNLFETKIKALDYSLCFYDDKINMALASGSFFDSIKYLKPVLALQGNPFVDYYFEKLGNIGYRFNTIEDIACFLNNLSPAEMTNYEKQIQTMKKAQEILSLPNITKSFERQLLTISAI